MQWGLNPLERGSVCRPGPEGKVPACERSFPPWLRAQHVPYTPCAPTHTSHTGPPASPCTPHSPPAPPCTPHAHSTCFSTYRAHSASTRTPCAHPAAPHTHSATPHGHCRSPTCAGTAAGTRAAAGEMPLLLLWSVVKVLTALSSGYGHKGGVAKSRERLTAAVSVGNSTLSTSPGDSEVEF